MAEIRRLSPDDWETLRDVRLRSLADAPGAFLSTLEREQTFEDAEWQRRAANGASFVASQDGRPVGIAIGLVDTDDPARCHLVGMWVEPAARGTGTAAALVDTVREWAAGTDGASVLVLGVMDGNEVARRLYVRLGFTPTGRRDGNHEWLRLPLS